MAPECGDGVVASPEECDDGNDTAGDGCSATCQVESGFTCEGTPSVCSTLPSCTDTDGGKNYGEKCSITHSIGGTSPGSAVQDSCQLNANPDVRLEGYCDENGIGQIEEYICPFGCSSGTCLPETETGSTAVESA
jgi:cysteine-rich repeat protein